MCFAGAVVACWSLTQEVAGSSPFTVMGNFLSLNSANSVKTFRKNSNVNQLFLENKVFSINQPKKDDD